MDPFAFAFLTGFASALGKKLASGIIDYFQSDNEQIWLSYQGGYFVDENGFLVWADAAGWGLFSTEDGWEEADLSYSYLEPRSYLYFGSDDCHYMATAEGWFVWIESGWMTTYPVTDQY